MPKEFLFTISILAPISINLSKRAILEEFIPTSFKVTLEDLEINAAMIKKAEDEKSPGTLTS